MTTSDRSPTRTIIEVGLGVLALATAAGVLARALPGPARLHVELPWWVVLLMFTIAQRTVLEVQRGRESRSVSLSEIPFVMGLLVLDPWMLLAARAAGAAIAQGIVRGQWRKPCKLLFNVVVAAAEVPVGVAVLDAVAGSSATPIRMWLAASLAATLASIVGGIAVSTVISRLASDRSWRDAVAIGWWGSGLAFGLSSAGYVALLALHADRWSVLPLLAVAALAALAYRGYASLAERHSNVERLYTFSQVLNANAHAETLARLMLEEITEALSAEGAHIIFVEGGEPTIEIVVRRDAPVVTHEVPAVWPEGQALERLTAGESLLLGRASRDTGLLTWLATSGARNAIMTPIVGNDGELVALLIVTDRMGEVRGFDAGDVQMLETIASQAAVALRHGELLRQLRHDAMHDALTGAPNRNYLQREVEKRLGGEPFAVAMIDLDSFKDVNDTLGHDHGDVLLQEVARRLGDAVAAPALATRFGGDEFAVLLPHCATEAAAVETCRALRAAICEPVIVAGVTVDASASIGIACYPAHAATWSDLMKRADQAMYVAKRTGRGVAVFDSTLDTSSPERLSLGAALRGAVNERLVQIHVQPQISLATGRVVGVEALARWTDPVHGMVPPDEFIALAEKIGLIGPLTDLVLERSLGACAAWQSWAPGLAVAVNLSATSLQDDTFVEHIAELLQRHRLDPALLTLELTETSVMSNPASTRRILERLRALGVRLSIDDFGTGYSSLSHLRRLPVHEVKVDRSFVQRMHEEANDASIVRSVIDLARTLDLEVVAEGVEVEAASDLLRTMGCHLVQGYWISRPLPLDAFREWFEQRSSADLLPRPREQHLGVG